MTSRLSKWIGEGMHASGLNPNMVWDASWQWEQDYSKPWEPIRNDKDLKAREDNALDLVDKDPDFALTKFIALADEGSAFAMRWAGYLYSGTLGVAKNEDLAEEYFKRAICKGSSLAAIHYANALYRRGAHDLWPEILNDGMKKGYIPAFYWHGRNSYHLHPCSQTAIEARPALVRAAEAGHLGAKAMLIRWTFRGRFGFSKVPEGFSLFRSLFRDLTEGASLNQSGA